MWRQRASQVSNAEIAVFKELSARKLTEGMVTQHAFTLVWSEDGVHGTITDFYWHRYEYVVYLDGVQVHVKPNQSSKDVLVTKALIKRGKTVDRYTYKAPLTETRKVEICDLIQEKLGRFGYE